MAKEDTTAVNALSYAPVGEFGIEVAQDGEHLHIRLPKSSANARLSQSGKMKITASTGGWTNIPGTDIRMNLNTGVRA